MSSFSFSNLLVTVVDETARDILQRYSRMRSKLAKSLISTTVPEPTEIHNNESSKITIQPEDALIYEANETLELAEAQLTEGMNEAASRNFHTATVYYRVLESMVPNISLDLHAKLEYAAARTRQCSQLIQNFVQEHFQGTRCSDVYDIIKSKRLGKGSYGSVYLCKHKKTGDSFAVKIINVTRINSHSLRKLHLEIAIMKSLDHPNIIKLRGVFFGRRTVSLVMDLCQGGELFDQLTGNQANKKGFPEAYAARLIRFMLSSIGYLHSQGIMHRDIKLENFLFQTKEMSSGLCLIDFGLSKHYCAFETMHQVVGSAYYTAPEVLRGSYDYRCDIWSLGVVAYMLLTGSPPFNGSNSDAIHLMIQKSEPDFSARKFPRASPLAIDFLTMMLQKDPNRRISLDDASRHPFILQANSWHEGDQTKLALSSDVVTSLKNFSHLSKFKRLTLELLAFNMNTSQIASLRDEFNIIDVDGSGTISLDEFKNSLIETHGLSPEGAEEIFYSVDIDKSTFINYNEFVAAAMGRRISIEEDQLMLAFDTLDVHKTGKLDAKGIKAALGDSMNDQDVEQMMKEIDYDNNGELDYIEFAKFWKGFVVSQKLAPFKRVALTVRRMTSAIKAFEFSVSSRSNSVTIDDKAATGEGTQKSGTRHLSSSILKKMGSSGLLKRSGQLDASRNCEQEAQDEDDDSSDEDDNNVNNVSAASLDPKTASARKGSINLTVDAAQANSIMKTPSSAAGDLISSEGTPKRTPSRTPTGQLVATPARKVSQTTDTPETFSYQRSKSDSRNMHSMVAPSPKTAAKILLEDAVREVEPMLPPIHQTSRDTSNFSRQPSRQPSKEHGAVLRNGSKDQSGGVNIVQIKSRSFRSEETEDATRKLLQVSDRSGAV